MAEMILSEELMRGFESKSRVPCRILSFHCQLHCVLEEELENVKDR
jgi:hypothetical protein